MSVFGLFDLSIENELHHHHQVNTTDLILHNTHERERNHKE